MKRIAAAAEGSWEDVKRTADAVLEEARATATGIVDRLRAAMER